MSTYRVEWRCCGSVTETDAWEPDSCPFCTPVQRTPLEAAAPELLAALQVAREFMSIASDWNVDEAEINGETRSTYDLIADVDAVIVKASGAAQ